MYLNTVFKYNVFKYCQALIVNYVNFRWCSFLPTVYLFVIFLLASQELTIWSIHWQICRKNCLVLVAKFCLLYFFQFQMLRQHLWLHLALGCAICASACSNGCRTAFPFELDYSFCHIYLSLNDAIYISLIYLVTEGIEHLTLPLIPKTFKDYWQILRYGRFLTVHQLFSPGCVEFIYSLNKSRKLKKLEKLFVKMNSIVFWSIKSYS